MTVTGQPLFLLLLQTMNQKLRAHLALLATTLIFGLHYTIAKSMMPYFLSPMQLIFFRLLGGVILFWLFQRLFVREKVEKRDLLMLAICGVFGFALNQSLFYEGLNMTTPVDASVIHVMNPILVLIFASILISERVTPTKVIGILIGASGALILILFGRKLSFSGSSALGNLLVLLNMVFYALYLVLIKPLVAKYHTTTILKWVSLFGFLSIFPFAIGPALSTNFGNFDVFAWGSLAFIILFCTFLAYLLINYALKRLSPSAVSYYNYLQPVIASVSSLSLGEGKITWVKVMAAMLIFIGVYIVSWQKKGVKELQQMPER